MKLELKTSVFQDLLSKAIKGVSNNRLFPITSLMGIGVYTEEEGTVLQITTYDGVNIINLFYNLPTALDINKYVAVEANKLYDLVSKITDETLQLIFLEESFNVKSSNGTFKFNIAIEEGFGVVEFPDYQTALLQEDGVRYYEIPYKDLELLLTVNESAAAKTSEVICLTGAYISDKIITTDSYVACITDKDLFGETFLMDYSTINLIPILNESDQVGVIVGEERIMLYTGDYIIIGRKMQQVKDYPGEEIKEFLNLQFTNECLIKKAEMLDALERLNIFITPFDKNIMELSFTKDKLTIKSLNSNAVESIPIKNGADLVCLTGFSGLKNQVASILEEVFTLKFGNEIAIALVDKAATHIISLTEAV